MRDMNNFEEKLDENNILIFTKPTFYLKKIKSNKKIIIGDLRK